MGITYAVGNIMTTNIVAVEATATLATAVSLMVRNEIGSVVVTASEKMVGILTERDVMKLLCDDPGCCDRIVGDVMSRPLVTIDGRAALGKAADVMADKRIRRLLVVEEDQIKGIVTERDLLKATLDVFVKLSDAWV